MVLQNASSQTRQVPFHIPRLELDASRIVAISGALLLNLAVLLLLLVPAGMPKIAAITPDPTWIPPLLDPVKPPPPLPPPTVDVIKPKDTVITPPQTVSPPAPTPTVPDQIVMPEGTLQADPVIDTPTQSSTADIAPGPGPIAGVQLEYLSASAPPYPREQLLAGIQGTVMLKVLVDVDGRPIQVDISTSSGDRKLDEVARRHVLRNWTFRPAMQDGHAVQAIGIVPIEFNLGR